MKWKDQSYLHNTWVKQEVFEKERFGKAKLQRYMKAPIYYDELDEPFNPDFIEVKHSCFCT